MRKNTEGNAEDSEVERGRRENSAEGMALKISYPAVVGLHAKDHKDLKE